MDEDQWLLRHGLRPDGAGLDEVRVLLNEQIRLERGSQGHGDTILMKLCCVQLFHAAVPDDVLLIWKAKTASFDAYCSIDIQLLCGGGLEWTKAYLSAHPAQESQAALARLLHCEEAGDFDDFSPAERSAMYAAYYL
ncbi:hypothetical protein ACGF5F_12215 [Streptomyces sp. NPDC047821]|uniref:hypothetical protein n=1 Tax=Streptomyces sp. NPDC047821 TaxID=3365488 RepID=UPI003718E7E4